jgi:hypothetical protein
VASKMSKVSYGATMDLELENLDIMFKFKVQSTPYNVTINTLMHSRNRNIFDQQTFPVCTAVAALDLLAYAQVRTRNQPTRYSVSMTYLAAQLMTHTDKVLVEQQFLSGLPLSVTLQSVIKFGTVPILGSKEDLDPELMMRYIKDHGETIESYLHKFANIPMNGSLQVSRLYPSIDNIRQALFNGYAVAFAIRIDVNINEWFTNKTMQASTGYVIPISSPFDRVATHAMHIVSSDDSTRLFKVKNSMGADFGDSGYCYTTYSSVLDHSFTGLAFFIMG